MAIMDGCAIGPQCLTCARMTPLEKEREEEARQRAGRLDIIRLKDKVGMVIAKGETPDAGKWNTIDLKVKIQWFKQEGNKSMSRNKYGLLLLLLYRETCTCVVAAVTYRDDDEEAIATGNGDAAIHVAVDHVFAVGGATAAAVVVATAIVDPTGVL
jgi:hypothetical protein